MKSIEWRAVAKRFGAVTVIPDFSLTIAPGEFVVLLGPSGCGKTTLMRMLAGLEAVSAGQVLIDGQDVTHKPPGQRGVAMVFQQYALYPHMSVRDNMAFGLRNIGLAEAVIDERVQAAAKMLELQPLLQRKPTQLSGGQRQRVAIGRAVVKEPAAFLFDEPLSNLDAALRSRTRVELAQLHKRLGATMVFVTHDQVEAMTLADRIVVMNSGRVEQVGTPMEIYRKPATRFVAGFVGSPAMNMLPVQPARWADGRLVVRLPGGRDLTVPLQTSEATAATELGVRAEALRLRAEGELRGTVAVVERLGERTLVHVQTEACGLLVAEGDVEHEPRIGDTVALGIDAARVHLFDAQGVALRV
jgi:multiple sugar transport system ATP-binding protein